MQKKIQYDGSKNTKVWQEQKVAVSSLLGMD
jgi:hypothetical protein